MTAPAATKAPPPLPAASAPLPEKNPFLPSATPPAASAAPFGSIALAAPPAPAVFDAGSTPVAPPRVYIPDDLPDLLDGRARKRRAIVIVVSVALTALLGSIAAAIASHYRPL